MNLLTQFTFLTQFRHLKKAINIIFITLFFKKKRLVSKCHAINKNDNLINLVVNFVIFMFILLRSCKKFALLI